MATILRSIKFVHKFNIGPGGRRLGSAALHGLNGTRPLRAQPLVSFNFEQQNYVTNVAAKQNYNNRGNIDLMLNDMDRKIRNFGNIKKSDVEDLLLAVIENGSITSTQALLLIRCCGEFLSSESLQTRQSLVKNVWDTVTGLGVQLDISHYNALLLVNLENETDFSPLDILVELKKKNIEPNRVTFQRLIEQYCNKGDIAGATKILEHMSAQEIPINEVIFNSLIKGHSEAGDVQSSVKILEIMKQAGIQPTPRSYTAVLCTHAKRGDVESIRQTLDECREKDVLLTNKDILQVIYTLALNQHLEYIDEIMSLLLKGSTYNRDTIPFIYKLIEKDCIDTAFKLLKSLVKSPSRLSENENSDSGQFFIRKLVTSDVNAETIIKYCTIMQEENLNKSSFILAIYTAFTNDKHHLALPLLKALKESGAEVREHYFYPLFVSYSKVNNLQGILNTMKTMIFDFNIVPSVLSVKDYIIPFMVENPISNCNTLVENNLPFSVAANAMLLHLLNQNKTIQAVKFVNSTHMPYRARLIVRPLVNALVSTKDVKSFINILHYQYVHMLNDTSNNNDENTGEQMSAKQFVNITLTKAIDQLSKLNTECIIEIVKGLSENGISIDDQAAEKIKLHLDKNLTPEIRDIINVLVSGDLTPLPLPVQQGKRLFSHGSSTTNLDNLEQMAEGSVEFKLLLLQTYTKIRNHEGVAKILEELEKENTIYTVGVCASLIDYYTRSEKIQDADKWFEKLLETNPECKIDKVKILNYAELLVKNNRIEDALKALNVSVHDEDADKSFSCEKLLSTVKKNYPDRIDEVFNILNDKGFIVKITVSLLGPLIRAPLDLGDTTKAIEKFRWACEKFKLTPQRNILMMKLINDEDAKSLQHVTDLCTGVYGEMNALFDLAIAFFDCNRPRQARKILETPGLRIRKERVLYTAQKLSEQSDTEQLENFIKLLTGLFFDMDPLYTLLLQTYEKDGKWEKCLSLWTQMQEDNILPSSTFMGHLERVLRKCKQEIPFASAPTEFDAGSGLVGFRAFQDAVTAGNLDAAKEVVKSMPEKQQNSYYVSLIEAYLNVNNVDMAVLNLMEYLDKKIELQAEAQPVITSLFAKLIEKNDFNALSEIMSKFSNTASQKRIPLNLILNTCFFEAGKYKEFITYLESMLDDSSKKNPAVKLMFHNTVAAKAMLNNSEVEEKVKQFAWKAISHDIYSPINTVWIHEFLKGSPEAEQIWEEHLKKNPYFHSISAVYICKDRAAWSKIPEIAEKLGEASNIQLDEKRRSFASYFKCILDSEEPNKYELAYECLRHAVKSIGFDRINPKLISTLEQNLPNGLSIQALKTENEERTQEKATG